MEKKTDKKKEITLTSSQQRAFDQFKDFIESDKKVFILKGYAGTGKTTLLNSFVEELKEREEVFKLLASTGRAAKIMRDRTGIPAATIHSTIYKFSGLNQNLDEIYKNDKEPPERDNTGQFLIQFKFEEKDQTKKEKIFYLIDEASMIGNQPDKNPSQAQYGSGYLLSDLLRYDKYGKFVFVGDNCQLPPIGIKESPALSSEYFSSVFGLETEIAELKQIVRQEKSNGIIWAAEKVRVLYENPDRTRKPTFPILNNPQIKVYSGSIQMIYKYIEDVQKNGYEESTLICRSNKESVMLSHMIRPSLHIEGLTIGVNDLLLVTQNNYVSGLMNGDFVKVTQVLNRVSRAGLTFVLVEVEELSSKRRFSQYLIEDILVSNYANLTQAQQKALFLDFYFRMKNKNIKQESSEFEMQMRLDPFYNALRASYGYAVTCHKSQGGEWKRVYISTPDYMYNAQRSDYQWFYTAMTRASENLCVVKSITFTE